jgi:hypothetical protein
VFLINASQGNITELPFWIQLACTLSLGLSVTTLPFLSIVILRLVPLERVFLLPVPSVGTLTSLIKRILLTHIS